MSTDQPPISANTPMLVRELEVDGAVQTGELRISDKFVSPDYFKTLGIPITSGRTFTTDESRAAGRPSQPFAERSWHEGSKVPIVTPRGSRKPAVVDAAFARRFWPNGAIGHTFRLDAGMPLVEIVGVAGHVRTDAVSRPGGQGEPLLFYTLKPPPAPSRPARGNARARSGPSYAFVQLTLRLSSPDRAEEVFRAARAIAPKFQMEGKLVDDAYADFEHDTQLMTRTVGAFAVVAFVVSMVGLYGVMAFIVAGRRREIGIRMTLGASRVVRSQLYGVAPTDPPTYAAVVATVAFTAVLATLHPLRQAWRTDPAVTLRAE